MRAGLTAMETWLFLAGFFCAPAGAAAVRARLVTPMAAMTVLFMGVYLRVVPRVGSRGTAEGWPLPYDRRGSDGSQQRRRRGRGEHDDEERRPPPHEHRGDRDGRDPSVQHDSAAAVQGLHE